MERLPSSLMSEEILRKLDLETLCMVACASRYFRDSVHGQVLPSLSSLHLKFPVDGHTLSRITRAAATPALRHLTLNCQRLHPPSIARFLVQAPNIQHLLLFSCSNLSPQFLSSIGDSCPFLTELVLELPHRDSSLLFKTNLAYMLTGCKFLESLDLKIKGINVDANAFCSIGYFLPKTIKVLKLKPMLVNHAIPLITQIGIGYKRPAILLLDEATSALDTESERCIVSALESSQVNGDGEEGEKRRKGRGGDGRGDVASTWMPRQQLWYTWQNILGIFCPVSCQGPK